MNTRQRLLVLVGVLGTLAGLGRVWASGIPEAGALTYSGTLGLESGEPLTGEPALQLILWDSAELKNTPLCQDQPTRRKLIHGHFSIPLEDGCVAAIKSHADVWSELFVNGESVGRSKLGAVPYAVEAAHAVKADSAAESFEVSKDIRVGGTALVQGGAQLDGSVHTRDTLIRRVARAHGLGPGDQADVGAIPSRTLQFKKTEAATGIRVSYTDNLRVGANSSGQGSCRYELRFNGESCTKPGPLIYDLYFGGVAGLNLHRADSVFGTCFGLAAKEYTIQVYVGPLPAATGQPQGDCYTGWAEQYWAIEAEEVY